MTDKITIPAHVELSPVDSKHHSRAGYDAEAKHLYIDFAQPGRPANVYRYDNFGPTDWQDYQNADSKGRHFLGNIKPHTQKFPYAKVTNEQ